VKDDPIDKNVPLDIFRFFFIALKYCPHYNFIEFKVDGFVQEILDLNKYFSESDFNDVLLIYLDSVDLFLTKNEKKSTDTIYKNPLLLIPFKQRNFFQYAFALSKSVHNEEKEYLSVIS